MEKPTKLLGVLALFSLGGIFIWLSIYVPSPLKTEAYRLEISSNVEEGKTVYLNSFNLKYNFTEDNGLIGFEVREDQNFQLIQVEFDKFPKVKDIKIHFEHNISPETDKDSHIVVIHNSSKFVNDTEVKINFKSNIAPGYFVIGQGGSTVVHDGDPAVEFKLGDKYSCTGRCIIPIKNIEEDVKSSPNQIRVNFKNEKEGRHRFKIQAVKNYNIFEKDEKLFFGIGVSILSAAIVSLISLLTNSEEKSRLEIRGIFEETKEEVLNRLDRAEVRELFEKNKKEILDRLDLEKGEFNISLAKEKIRKNKLELRSSKLRDDKGEEHSGMTKSENPLVKELSYPRIKDMSKEAIKGIMIHEIGHTFFISEDISFTKKLGFKKEAEARLIEDSQEDGILTGYREIKNIKKRKKK